MVSVYLALELTVFPGGGVVQLPEVRPWPPMNLELQLQDAVSSGPPYPTLGFSNTVG